MTHFHTLVKIFSILNAVQFRAQKKKKFLRGGTKLLTVAYMGGGGSQKWPKTCLRNLWTAPIEMFVSKYLQGAAKVLERFSEAVLSLLRVSKI